jgi:hypothetical protein
MTQSPLIPDCDACIISVPFHKLALPPHIPLTQFENYALVDMQSNCFQLFSIKNGVR